MNPIPNLADYGVSFYKLSYQEWVAIDEPVFYNFALGDDKKIWLHLDKVTDLSVYSIRVNLMKVGDKLYKLDGKRRKKEWESGQFRIPPFLIAEVYEVSETVFSSLTYKAMDIEKDFLLPHEIMKQNYEELGVSFHSERFKNGYLKESLDIALRGKTRRVQNKASKFERQDINIKKALAVFEEELAFLDSLNAKADIFVTGVVAGALVMLGIAEGDDKDHVKTFLSLLNQGEGQKKDGTFFDPVASLLRSIEDHRAVTKNKPYNIEADLCSKTVHAIDVWLAGPATPPFWRKNKLGGIDHVPYVVKLKVKKGIMKDPEL